MTDTNTYLCPVCRSYHTASVTLSFTNETLPDDVEVEGVILCNKHMQMAVDKASQWFVEASPTDISADGSEAAGVLFGNGMILLPNDSVIIIDNIPVNTHLDSRFVLMRPHVFRVLHHALRANEPDKEITGDVSMVEPDFKSRS